MSTPESTDKDSKRHRRSHRKSRHGCVECKQRKIKCDETWPICLNCVKRDVLCSSPSRPVNHPDTAANANANRSENLSHTARSYRRGLRFVPSAYNSDCRAPDAGRRSGDLTASGDRPVTPRRVISNLQLLCGQLKLPESSSHPLSPEQSSSGLSYFDLELWHHYVLLTSGTVAEWSNGPGNHFWRVKLPEMGFQHPHILHLLLGLGALHKARVSPAQRSSLLAQADAHHVIGMRGATEMLRTINLVDFQAAFASTILISLFSLGMGPRQGEYIGFSDGNEGSFLTFLRGVRCINELQPIREPDDGDETEKSPHGPYTCATTKDASYLAHMQYLRSIATAITDPLDTGSAEVYIKAMDSLEPFLSAAFEEGSGSLSASVPYSNVPFAWLYRLTKPFLDRLQRKVPLALAIFACWAVVLGELETSWITEGWPEHIVCSMCQFLDPEHKDLVSWPVKWIRQKSDCQE